MYPAIRARMGDWNYYIVRMTMREIANEVNLATDEWEDPTLGVAIQRELQESRVKGGLVNYLAHRDDRFFSSLVVAAIGGNPGFDLATPPDWSKSKALRDSVGLLYFDDNPKYYALDGQHRLQAIKELLEDPKSAPAEFGSEQVSVIVVPREEQHKNEDIWLQRYRRLFSSLNRYAKPTDKDTNIIMDEDDVFAIVTRRLISDHRQFRAAGRQRDSFRVLTKGKNLKSGASHFTSLQTLYAMNEILLTTPDRERRLGGSKGLKASLQFRPEENLIDADYASVARCWDAILAVVPSLTENPSKMRAHRIPDPNPDGHQDHLLFWPIGQEMFAGVVRWMLNRERLGEDATTVEMMRVLRPLGAVPWELHEPPWRHLLLVKSDDGGNWKMRSEDRKPALEVAEQLLRWIAGIDDFDEGELTALRKRWADLLYPPLAEKTEAAEWKRIEAFRLGIATAMDA